MKDSLRKALWERSRGLCEICGHHLPTQGWHGSHRRPRGMGGTRRPDTPANLMAAHAACHLGRVERFREDALDRGWLLPSACEHPEWVPVYLFGVAWVYLTTDGRYRALDMDAQAEMGRLGWPGLEVGL